MTDWKEKFINQIVIGNSLEVLKELPDECVDTIITSPPYWGLRDYGVDEQLGLEPTLDEYLNKTLLITAELKRVLKKTGVMFWNHGDSYSGGMKSHKKDEPADAKRPGRRFNHSIHYNIAAKCLIMQNYRLAINMIDRQGWILRNSIIWYKKNSMPSSVTDRLTNKYEPIFMFTKNRKYWFDLDAIRTPHKNETLQRAERNSFPNLERSKSLTFNLQSVDRGEGTIQPHPFGKNPGDVFEISTQPFKESHFAVFPERLIEPFILAACPQWICKKCGKPRTRIIEETKIENPHISKYRSELAKAGMGGGHWGLDNYLKKSRKFIGWSDCGCGAGWEPGIVLDPFMRSGTTARVAKRLERYYIGIELNPDYVNKIAKKYVKQNVIYF